MWFSENYIKILSDLIEIDDVFLDFLKYLLYILEVIELSIKMYVLI